jgi:hypothetical protein
LSERYHEAKKNGNDPDLVNAFEKVLGGKQVTQEVVTEENKVESKNKPKRTVGDLIGGRVTLNEFGGVKFEQPLIGDLYVIGQQVVFEDSASDKFYELGNVNEISNKAFKEIGVDNKTTEGDIAQSSVVPTENGRL